MMMDDDDVVELGRTNIQEISRISHYQLDHPLHVEEGFIYSSYSSNRQIASAARKGINKYSIQGRFQHWFKCKSGRIVIWLKCTLFLVSNGWSLKCGSIEKWLMCKMVDVCTRFVCEMLWELKILKEYLSFEKGLWKRWEGNGLS